MIGKLKKNGKVHLLSSLQITSAFCAAILPDETLFSQLRQNKEERFKETITAGTELGNTASPLIHQRTENRKEKQRNGDVRYI